MNLKAYAASIAQSPDALADLLEGKLVPEVRDVSPSIEISGLRSALTELSSNFTDTELDAKAVKAVHQGLPLTRREALQPDVWNWLCVEPLLEFAWGRWSKGVALPSDRVERARLVRPGGGSHTLAKRLLALPSLGGLGRNALARLWWAGEVLREGDDYFLAEMAIGRAQLWVDLFERRLGLNVPLACEVVRQLHAEPDALIMQTGVFLNKRVKTTQLEGFGSEPLKDLVAETIELARRFPAE